ncbi:MAG: SynChlorMet cassette radical SAM/SPASM protein ScmE, partial [Candidatus Poribacteria bacterium]
MRLMKTPRSVDIEITTRCNLRCKYCAHFTSAGDVDNDLPKEEWLKFFEELNRCAVMDVVLSGGEPFHRNDIMEIIEGIVKNKMRYSILSNGTLITDEIAKFIADTKRCNYVQVSIDGSKPESHDIFRGKGTFEKAINGLKNLRKNGVNNTVRVTIHKYNVSDLDHIAKLLLEDIGLNGFSTNVASYQGLCRENNEQIKLDAETQSLAMETLLRLTKKYNGRITANAGPLANARMWLEMEKARREGLESMPGRGCLSGCGAMMSKIAVRADGVLVPC